MKKLLKLLNEYRTEKGERNLNESEVSQTLDSLNYLRLFIKWLVENDKINVHRVEVRPFSDDITIREFPDYIYEMVLMLLSISDTPIEDLISYLK